MLFIQSEVCNSQIAGQGLFTLEFLPKGKIVGIWTLEMQGNAIIDEKLYMEEIKNASEQYKHSFVRLVGKYFVGNYEKKEPDDYLNHSNDYNLLSHCGILFALKDIEIGEELTLNYRYLYPFAECFHQIEVDEKPIISFSGKETLVRSAR